MKSTIITALILFSSLAMGNTSKFTCVVESSRDGRVETLTAYLEHDLLYAPAFQSDLAEGKNGVTAKSRTGDDRVFERLNEGDLITITLTQIGQALTLTNWKYVERIDAAGVGSILLRIGFCTAEIVN